MILIHQFAIKHYTKVYFCSLLADKLIENDKQNSEKMTE